MTQGDRELYAAWWYGVLDLSGALLDDLEHGESEWLKNSEDLGDFVQSIRSIVTFGPNPLAWDPPIPANQGCHPPG